MEKGKRHKQGYFTGLGLAIGIPMGIPIGLAMGNIALGPALGVAIGLPIGAAMEKKYNPNPIPLTNEEKKRQKKFLWWGIGAGVVLFALGVVVFLMVK